MSFRFSFGIGLLGILGILTSCYNEVDHLVDGPATSVVYCLLDPDEPIQYARIGKTFGVAKGHEAYYPYADSIVWQENFDVYIEEWSEEGEQIDIFYFDPSSGMERDTGYFPREGLAVFESDFQPERFKTYAIYVHFEDEDRVTSGWTTIAGQSEIFDPLNIPGRTINLQPNTFYTVRWGPAPMAGSYQYEFTINYEETSGQTNSVQQLMIPSRVFFALDAPQVMLGTLLGDRFFEEINKQVHPVAETITRKIINVTFEMIIGGEELSLFLSNDLSKSSVSTSLNNYTNLVNGMGVFSSINKARVSNLMLSNATLDALAYSDKTRELGFLDHYGKR